MTKQLHSTPIIKVCDAFMGSGKTTAAIRYMNENPYRRFIYVAPRLSENDRIVRCCPSLHFQMPDDDRDEPTKLANLKALMHRGKNVAITHSLFALCDDDVCDIMQQHGYALIIDEVVNVLCKSKVTNKDVAAMINNGFASVDENGYVTVAPDYTEGEHGDAFRAAMRLAGSHKLFKTGKCYYSWVISDRMLRSASEVIVLTFMFESSSMIRLLKETGLEYTHIFVDTDGAGHYWFTEKMSYIPSYVGQLSELITIVDNERLNRIGNDTYALSKTWWEKQWKEYKRLADYDPVTKTYKDNEQSKQIPVAEIRKNVYSYFEYEHRDIPADDLLWGGFSVTKDCLKRKGFISAFLTFNATSMNDFSDRHFLAYPVNVFFPRELTYYYKSVNLPANEDDFALTSMIQWIWRSAIRNGEPIELYLPSTRMRRLLEDWIKKTEDWYHEFYSSTVPTHAPRRETSNEGGEIISTNTSAA